MSAADSSKISSTVSSDTVVVTFPCQLSELCRLNISRIQTREIKIEALYRIRLNSK